VLILCKRSTTRSRRTKGHAADGPKVTPFVVALELTSLGRAPSPHAISPLDFRANGQVVSDVEVDQFQCQFRLRQHNVVWLNVSVRNFILMQK